MDNNSYRTLYIESNMAETSQASDVAIQNFWLRVAKFENSKGKRLEDGYSPADYVELLEHFNVINVNMFYSTKSRISAYLKWLVGQGLIDQSYVDNLRGVKYAEVSPDRIYDLKYFPSFESLQDAIKNTLFAAERIDDAVYALHISALYLAWCGLSIEEALALKKSDVKEDHIIVGDRALYPSNIIMNHLVEYRDAVSYEQQGKGVIVRKYMYSDYLFRTSSAPHVASPKNLRIFLRVFGKSGGEENIYNYDKVYWSGLFRRAYEYECENGMLYASNIELLEQLFQEKYANVSAAFKRLSEYQKFRDYFYEQ